MKKMILIASCLILLTIVSVLIFLMEESSSISEAAEVSRNWRTDRSDISDILPVANSFQKINWRIENLGTGDSLLPSQNNRVIKGFARISEETSEDWYSRYDWNIGRKSKFVSSCPFTLKKEVNFKTSSEFTKSFTPQGWQAKFYFCKDNLILYFSLVR